MVVLDHVLRQRRAARGEGVSLCVRIETEGDELGRFPVPERPHKQKEGVERGAGRT